MELNEKTISEEEYSFMDILSNLVSISIKDIESHLKNSSPTTLASLLDPSLKKKANVYVPPSKWSPEDVRGAFAFLFESGEGSLEDLARAFDSEFLLEEIRRRAIQKIHKSVGGGIHSPLSLRVVVTSDSLCVEKLKEQLLVLILKAMKDGDINFAPVNDNLLISSTDSLFILLERTSKPGDRRRRYSMKVFKAGRTIVEYKKTSFIWNFAVFNFSGKKKR